MIVLLVAGAWGDDVNVGLVREIAEEEGEREGEREGKRGKGGIGKRRSC